MAESLARLFVFVRAAYGGAPSLQRGENVGILNPTPATYRVCVQHTSGPVCGEHLVSVEKSEDGRPALVALRTKANQQRYKGGDRPQRNGCGRRARP